jgi:hypothetical protein
MEPDLNDNHKVSSVAACLNGDETFIDQLTFVPQPIDAIAPVRKQGDITLIPAVEKILFIEKQLIRKA